MVTHFFLGFTPTFTGKMYNTVPFFLYDCQILRKKFPKFGNGGAAVLHVF
jgi:hypothetical protein